MSTVRTSRWSLAADLCSAKALVWLATRAPDSELTAAAHWFFYDRYSQLAEWHRLRGRLQRARQLFAKAEAHRDAAGNDGPPYAAAMARPRPTRWASVDAISRTRLGGPPDAA